MWWKRNKGPLVSSSSCGFSFFFCGGTAASLESLGSSQPSLGERTGHQSTTERLTLVTWPPEPSESLQKKKKNLPIQGLESFSFISGGLIFMYWNVVESSSSDLRSERPHVHRRSPLHARRTVKLHQCRSCPAIWADVRTVTAMGTAQGWLCRTLNFLWEKK